MGVQVVPRFTVFQTFDDEVATYHTLRSVGSTATSAIRPDMKAGPTPRSSRAERRLSSTAVEPGDWAWSGVRVVQRAAARVRAAVVGVGRRAAVWGAALARTSGVLGMVADSPRKMAVVAAVRGLMHGLGRGSIGQWRGR